MKKYDFFFILCYLNFFSCSAASAADKTEDSFYDPSQWSIDSSASVHVSRVDPVDSNNHALCFVYSANEDGGNVVLYRQVRQNFPLDFQLQLTVRSQDEIKNLQIYLNNSNQGQSWFSQPLRLISSSASQVLRFSPSQLITYSFDENFKPVHLIQSNELYIKLQVPSSEGHTFCFEGLAINPVASPPSISSFHPSVTVDTAPALQHHIVDGNEATYWLSGSIKHQTIALDLGSPLPLGGVILDWVPGLQATAYSIRSSLDDLHWSFIHQVSAGLNPSQWIALPGTQARYLRFDLEQGLNWRYGLKEIRLQPSSFSNTPNDFVRNYARNFPLGDFPPFLSQGTSNQTPVGIDGGADFAVMSNFGAVELARDGITVEPMLVVDNKKIYNWATVHADQHLQDDYLPIPTVHWTSPYFSTSITAFSHDSDQKISTLIQYNIKNTTKYAHSYRLALAVRPFRASQKMNEMDDSGGLTPIKQLSILGRSVNVNGHLSFSVQRSPDIAVLTPFDSGMDFDHLFDIKSSLSSQVDDSTGLASGLLMYKFDLKPGESQSLFISAPLLGNPVLPDNLDVNAALATAETKWRRALNIFRVELPGESKSLFDSFRTAFANQLMCRDWQNALNQSQSYTRCHLTNAHSVVESLLRLGRFDSVRDFFNASISNQMKNRLLSCGQTNQNIFQAQIFNQAAWFHSLSDYAHYSHDRSLPLAMWPHLIQWFDSLPDPSSLSSLKQIQIPSSALFGVFPSFEVIESSAAQAATLSWQNLWTLSALSDATTLAKSLQKDKEISRLNAHHDAFVRSLFPTPDNQPLAQYDPSVYLDHDRFFFVASTDLLPHIFLPDDLLAFEQGDWNRVEKQLGGASPSANVFLNQWQTVATMVRSRSRDRAWKLSEMMLDLRQPLGWNQWPKFMDTTHPKRFFYGDLPDFSASADLVNAVLDLFFYDKPGDQALVLADGIPERWFSGSVPIIFEGIHTPYGLLNFQINHPDSSHVRVLIEEGTGVPPGGFIFYSPFQSSSPTVSVNQQPSQWDSNQAIVIHSVPARIDIALPPDQ